MLGGRTVKHNGGKKGPLHYFSFLALCFAIIHDLILVFKSKVWAAFMDEIIYTSGV